jgi:NADH-quinone oxidoreductase subunit J
MTDILFYVFAALALGGAMGVVAGRNPVASLLSMVVCLGSVACIYVLLEAHFLAAVQIIVYAGAIVVLFLFVIMLLGVDQLDDLETEPLVAQRPLALIAGFGFVLMAVLVYVLTNRDFDTFVTGAPSQAGALATSGTENLESLAHLVFTDYLYAFEITSVLLIIAVVGAVVLARRSPSGDEVSS